MWLPLVIEIEIMVIRYSVSFKQSSTRIVVRLFKLGTLDFNSQGKWTPTFWRYNFSTFFNWNVYTKRSRIMPGLMKTMMFVYFSQSVINKRQHYFVRIIFLALTRETVHRFAIWFPTLNHNHIHIFSCIKLWCALINKYHCFWWSYAA